MTFFFNHWHAIHKQNSQSTLADLLFNCSHEHGLPDGPDDGNILMFCGVAVSLDNMSQSQAADHSFENLLYMAKGQEGLCPGAGLHHLHGTWHQCNLARTENRFIYLEKIKIEEKNSKNKRSSLQLKYI